jgi:hypothetical protein
MVRMAAWAIPPAAILPLLALLILLLLLVVVPLLLVLLLVVVLLLGMHTILRLRQLHACTIPMHVLLHMAGARPMPAAAAGTPHAHLLVVAAGWAHPMHCCAVMLRLSQTMA